MPKEVAIQIVEGPNTRSKRKVDSSVNQPCVEDTRGTFDVQQTCRSTSPVRLDDDDEDEEEDPQTPLKRRTNVGTNLALPPPPPIPSRPLNARTPSGRSKTLDGVSSSGIIEKKISKSRQNKT